MLAAHRLIHLRKQLMIIVIDDYFLDPTISLLGLRTSENGGKKGQWCFPKPRMSSTIVLRCPQPTNIQLTVREEERNEELFIFKSLEFEKKCAIKTVGCCWNSRPSIHESLQFWFR